MRPRLSAALVLALAALALLGCGEDSPGGDQGADEAEIEALAARFDGILADRDAKAFCAVLAPNDVQKLGEGRTDGSKECLVVWGPRRNPLFAAKDPDLGVESLSFKGRYATAALANGGKLGFASEGGHWYVHLSPAPEQTKGVGS